MKKIAGGIRDFAALRIFNDSDYGALKIPFKFFSRKEKF